MKKDYLCDNEMEEEFLKTFNSIHDEIQSKLAAAAKLINEAEALSEAHGIPFRPDETIMFCEPSYIPESLQEKFPELNIDFWTEITGAYGYGYSGWQQSQVC